MFIGTILLLCRETAILLGSVLGATPLPGRQLHLDAKTKLITPCLGASFLSFDPCFRCFAVSFLRPLLYFYRIYPYHASIYTSLYYPIIYVTPIATTKNQRAQLNQILISQTKQVTSFLNTKRTYVPVQLQPQESFTAPRVVR
jgi:hypothetical protein